MFGLLAAALYRSERDELRRQCPGCGRVVKLHDSICTRCGAELYFPEVAINPESVSRAQQA
jgi:rRNA maturation endonuclease Nob1